MLFLAYLYSAGTQHGNLPPAGCRILFFRQILPRQPAYYINEVWGRCVPDEGFLVPTMKINFRCKTNPLPSSLPWPPGSVQQHRWLHNQFPPFFSVLHCSLAFGELQPVHFLMLSSHLFLCLPCLLPPFTVPRKMVLAWPDERETCPYHFSLCLFTMVGSFLCDPVACWILAKAILNANRCSLRRQTFRADMLAMGKPGLLVG